MRTRVIVVAAVALIGLFGGCSGGVEPGPTETAGEQTTAASPAASSLSAAPASPSSPSSSPSPTSSGSPAGRGQRVTAADGALSWTMPCKPARENISGNEADKKTYRSNTGWRCGKRGAATSGVFVVELVEKPASAEAALKAMETALKQVAPESEPTDNDLAGTPGISGTSKLNGKEFGFQVISFGSYLTVFIATPAKDLNAITDSVQVS